MSVNTSLAVTPTFNRTPMRSARCSEDDFRADGKETGERIPSNPQTPELAKPAQPRANAPMMERDMILIDQESLNALVGETLIDETIKLLTSSLPPATQSAYLRGWEFWNRYCESRSITPRIDMSVPDWDWGLLNYLTW